MDKYNSFQDEIDRQNLEEVIFRRTPAPSRIQMRDYILERAAIIYIFSTVFITGGCVGAAATSIFL